VATFESIARKYGAIDVHDFKQVQFLKSVTGEAHPQGKCFAFVLAYFTCLRTGLAGKYLLDNLERAVRDNDQSVIREILGDPAQISSNPNWVGKDLFNLQSLDNVLAEYYTAIGLTREKNHRFDDRFFRNRAVGRYISDSVPLYSIIKSRVHIMAAVSHPYSERDEYTFFDPNFGEAIFHGGEDLTRFVAAFFSRKVINRGYRPKIADLDNVPLMGDEEKQMVRQEARSLILTVEGFRESVAVPPPRRDQFGQKIAN